MDNATYEKNLEKIYDQFGRVALIPLLPVAEFVGLNYRTLLKDKGFPVKKVSRKYYVNTMALARWLS